MLYYKEEEDIVQKFVNKVCLKIATLIRLFGVFEHYSYILSPPTLPVLSIEAGCRRQYLIITETQFKELKINLLFA